MLMSVDDLEALEEPLHWQAQPGRHEDIATARQEAEAGTSRTSGPHGAVTTVCCTCSTSSEGRS
ncbi:hypothetical protein BST10_12315 [Mycolicibacter algericus DSM 45454]|uniref:Uncharacterized protein n=1 Tax=Mycolicibacter algericus DSM 45454 TaxID=723879 RepID=A0ABX3RQA8_MYCAL|nr:hypothetical protein BST10_12315 [Mycolicibacter algericus DSM 45454]